MCGRFSLNINEKKLEDFYKAALEEEYALPRYNIAPQTKIPVILNIEPSRIETIAWGLKFSWMKDKGKKGLINVRSETVLEKTIFKKSFFERRCIIPATSFFEWKKTEKHKIPFLIQLKEHIPMTFAGIWQLSTNSDGVKEQTVAILTTEANSVLEPIHNRMPVIIEERDIETWLQDDANTDDLVRIMSPFNPKEMEAYQISSKANSPSNDDPNLINPL